MKHKRPGLVVAIDGPAGAGKSTVARLLAEQLRFEFLDTGALYRCVTLAVLRSGIDPLKSREVARLARQLRIEFDGQRVRLDGDDVSHEIRLPEVGARIGAIADNIEVREVLTHWQRAWTSGRCVVTEGRDQGSEVFFDSPCKFFLIASDMERAHRRLRELRQRGITADFDSVLAQQIKRDQEDYSRPVGRLRVAEDATVVSTDGLSLEEVVVNLKAAVIERLSKVNLVGSAIETQPTGEWDVDGNGDSDGDTDTEVEANLGQAADDYDLPASAAAKSDLLNRRASDR